MVHELTVLSNVILLDGGRSKKTMSIGKMVENLYKDQKNGSALLKYRGKGRGTGAANFPFVIKA